MSIADAVHKLIDVAAGHANLRNPDEIAALHASVNEAPPEPPAAPEPPPEETPAPEVPPAAPEAPAPAEAPVDGGAAGA